MDTRCRWARVVLHTNARAHLSTLSINPSSFPCTPTLPHQNRFRAVGANVAEARAETLKATLATFKDKLDAFAHAHR